MSSDDSGTSRDSRPAEADRANQGTDGARERRATSEERATSAERSPGTSGDGTRRSGTGESIGQRFDAAQATLSRSGPKAQLTLLIGLFGLVGLGIGVTGAILSSTVSGGGGLMADFTGTLLSLATLVMVLFLGMALAGIGGLRVATDLDGEAGEVYLTAFVGNAAGYVVMGVVAVVLLGTGIGLGDLLVAFIVLGLIAGAVGCGVSALHRRVLGRAG